MLAGAASASDDGGPIDALAHPTPERRAAALRELQALPDGTLFPLLLAHVDDERPAVRRGVHRLLRGALFDGPETRRLAVLWALWDREEDARRFAFDLEACGRRFRTGSGALALAAAMRIRGDREWVPALARDPLGWPALERFDPRRSATLVALATLLDSPAGAGPASVAPFRSRPGAPKQLTACFRALAAAEDETFDARLAEAIREVDPSGLGVCVALACTAAEPPPACRAAVAARLREASPAALEALVGGLWAGGRCGARLRDGLGPVALARLRAGGPEGLEDRTRAMLLLAAAGEPLSPAWRDLVAASTEDAGLTGLAARLLLAPDASSAAELARRAWEAGAEGPSRMRQLWFAVRSGAAPFTALLVHVLREGDPAAVELVMEALPTFPRSPRIARALVANLGRFRGRAAAWAVECIARFDPELETAGAEDALADALRREADPRLRASALRACGWLHRFPAGVVEALPVEAPDDSTGWVLERVLSAAAHADARSAALVDFLVALADAEGPFREDDLLRGTAIATLARIAPDDARSRAAFRAALADPSDLMRENGAFAFLSVGRLTADERAILAGLAALDHAFPSHAIAARVLAAHDRPLEFAVEAD